MNKPDVATYQVAWELEQMLTLVHDTIVGGTVLEVGCYEGGTLWHWLQIADGVVAVDDRMRNGEEWDVWADDSDAVLVRLCGDSSDPRIVEAVRRRGPYDMVFIDADHTYAAVHADWENYRGMVADGGCIAFHDILPRPGYGVAEVWAEVKATDGIRYVEIAKNATEPGNDGPCGIGVAWLP